MIARADSLGRLLVTGATGLVGRAVLARAARPSRAVLQIRAALRTPSALLPAGTESLVVGDIDAITDWTAALSDVDVVVHLAARVHMLRDRARDAVRAYHTTNVDATLNLARQAARSGVRRFVFVSSIKVSGERTSLMRPFTEDDAPIPDSSESDPYARSKLLAELALRELGVHTGMQIVVVRPPLVYGPGVKANFAGLMRAVDRGMPFPLASVRNLRSLVAVDNLADFIMVCADHPAAANELFLVSDAEDLSTPDLIRGLASALGRPARLFSFPESWLRLGAGLFGQRAAAERLLDSLRVDHAKARRLLDWTPPVSVAEGLRRAVAPLRLGMPG